MADLYHIYLSPKDGVTTKQVENTMSLAVHWYRYAHGHFYVVETTSDESKWKERLEPLVKPGGNLFICKLDTAHYQGWMPKTFWEWFEKRKDQGN